MIVIPLGKLISYKGDDLVLFGNGLEMLQMSISQFDENNISLKPNEVYTPLFKDKQELAA